MLEESRLLGRKVIHLLVLSTASPMVRNEW
jgi:hypothetical protein